MIDTKIMYSDFLLDKDVTKQISSKESLYKEMAELDRRLKRDECYYGVILFQKKQSLCIGFCGAEWLLILTIEPGVQAQYRSKGDLSREGFSEIYWMDWNVVSNRSLIPKEQAWEAVKYWLDTGKLSPIIDWSDYLLL